MATLNLRLATVTGPLFRRIMPAVWLFFLAPLVAEFLPGNLPITMIGVLFILAPLYGGGALVIREVVRRTGRGWATILALALAYGVLEEAFITETLFNPNYLGLNLHLLDHAFIPALGIGAWWTVFVLTLHTVWSISISIGLAEALVPDRAKAPWLGRAGLAFAGVLFAIAAIAVTRFSILQDQNHFAASIPQFVTAGIVCAAIVISAFRLPNSYRLSSPGIPPRPWVIGVAALLAGSIFLLVPSRWGWWSVAAYLTLDLSFIATIAVWSSRRGWDGRHRLALSGGAAFAYAWHAFLQTPAVGPAGTIDRVGNVVFALAATLLLVVATRKVSVLAAPISGGDPQGGSS